MKSRIWRPRSNEVSILGEWGMDKKENRGRMTWSMVREVGEGMEATGKGKTKAADKTNSGNEE